MRFTDYPGVAIAFDSCDEKDFFIRRLGFHNFHFLKPTKLFRTQSFYTLHIILEGKGVVKVDGREYEASKGDMFFIPPKVNLSYYPDDEVKWKYAWFEMLGDTAQVYGNKMGFSKNASVKKCRSFEKTILLLERIFQDHLNDKSVGYYEVVSAFYKVLDYNVRKTENQSIADDVMYYVNCHFARRDLNVPEICERFNLSHSYLCRIFKSTVGMTVKNYIIKVRINEACTLFSTTDFGIKEVAYSVGFSDEIHFMKVFKTITEKTPTEYRKKNLYSENQPERNP